MVIIKKLTKCYNNRIKVQSYKDKLSVMLGLSKKLFDVFPTASVIPLTPVLVIKIKKVPITERSFMLDHMK